jgi:L-threonylcarbamoyladenylate synthase
MRTEVISSSHPSAIHHAIDVFNCNGLVAFPTDTVYGLGAPAFNEVSIERLYVVKGRNHTKAIALLLGSIDQLEQVASEITGTTSKLAETFWPGPLTLVMNRHPGLPDILAPEQTIGVRIPDHPDALKLIEETGPLAVTSANLSGEAPTRTAGEVLSQLNQKIHLVIDGGTTPGGIPSTVVDCTTTNPQILRKGPISFHKLKKALGS